MRLSNRFNITFKLRNSSVFYLKRYTLNRVQNQRAEFMKNIKILPCDVDVMI